MVGRHSAAGCRSNDSGAVGSLEIRLNRFVIAAVAQHHAAQLQALDAQQIDRLLAFVGEAQVFRVPSMAAARETKDNGNVFSYAEQKCAFS